MCERNSRVFGSMIWNSSSIPRVKTWSRERAFFGRAGVLRDRDFCRDDTPFPTHRVEPFFIDTTMIESPRASSAAFAICQLFFVRRARIERKKRTEFSKRGEAKAATLTHNAHMKTQALLERGSSTATDLKRILVPVD